jgi:hypothetical protein
MIANYISKRIDPSPFTSTSARILLCAALFATASTFAASSSNRVDLFPRLITGQVIHYEITYRNEKQTKTKSSVVFAEAPADSVADVRALLRVEILEASLREPRGVIRARTLLTALDADAAKAPQPSAQGRDAAPVSTLAVEFSIFPDGRIDRVTGLDGLSADQQQAWLQWAARFAGAAVFPPGGIKPAQKWKSQQAEKSPSPIAGLTWIRESTYVRNAPCRPLHFGDRGDFVESNEPPEGCAVVITTALLKQESKPKDATPEDFRVRLLRTSGTARGTNKTILYISLKTGLVVRASDEADQSMSVTIAKIDGSNRVSYDVQAKSAAEILLVTGDPPR